jgi:hypothetical protein
MRPTFLLIALLTGSACAAPPTVAPSPGPWRLSGTVSAMDGGRVGGPIAGAQLTVSTGATDVEKVRSDTAGRFVFASLASGGFTLTITAPGYVGVAPPIELYKDMEVNFALAPR